MSSSLKLKFSIIVLILIGLIFLLESNTLAIMNKSNTRTTKNNFMFITEKNGIKEYKTQNGIRVLLKENHSIPLVTFSIWYKVGSRNENSGIRGIAHFLEHMMFKGTKKFQKGEIPETIQRYGGVFNAFTYGDGTAYYETMPPKYLEKAIEIESDRMKNSIIDEKELALEKTVVLSELEGGLNNPAELLDQKVRNLAYEESPYKHPTIGYEEDIKKINQNIMKDFYSKHYNPNNSTIIIVGDFSKTNALNLIDKYFSNIENDHTNSKENIKTKNKNKQERIIVKKSGTTKLVEITYNITSVKHRDIYPLNIIEEILVKGKKSRLNKALIEKGLATEIYGGAETNKDPGLFYIVVSLTPKAKHKQVEKIITTEINKLIKNPPGVKEIDFCKNRIKAGYLFNLDGTYNQAINLGYFETTNTWHQGLDWPENIKKVTKDQVIEVLNKYFKKSNITIGYFIPKLRKGEKYENIPIQLGKTQHYTETTTLAKSITKNTTEIKRFKYKKIKLKEGSELVIYKEIDLPITYISGVIKGGNSLLPKEKEWICELIARTLEKGSKNYTKEQIEEFLDNTGSQISFGCDEESFKFQAVSLNENVKETTDLLLDLLLNPLFTSKEVKKEKDKLIAEIIELKDNTNEIANKKLTQLIYPPNHPYYENDFDTDIKLIKEIKNTDLLNSHEKLIQNNTILFSIVSNLDETNIKDEIEKKINNKPKNEIKINISDTPIKTSSKVKVSYLHEKPQSDVFIGHAGNIKRADLDFYKVHIANYIFGGSPLTSRLAKKVRDNHGLVYTIISSLSSTYGAGEFAIYFGANNNNVNKAIKLVKEEIRSFVKNGVTEEELTNAKASLVDSFVSKNLSSYGNIGNTLLGIEYYNLGKDYINEYPEIINSLKLSEVNSAIKKHIFPEYLNISIAGEYKRTRGLEN